MPLPIGESRHMLLPIYNLPSPIGSEELCSMIHYYFTWSIDMLLFVSSISNKDCHSSQPRRVVGAPSPQSFNINRHDSSTHTPTIELYPYHFRTPYCLSINYQIAQNVRTKFIRHPDLLRRLFVYRPALIRLHQRRHQTNARPYLYVLVLLY
jgi:hypothetical protein